MLHPNSAIERQTLPRNKGGRGIVGITTLCETQVQNIKWYFYKKKETSEIHRAIIDIEDGNTAINLREPCTQARKDQKGEDTTEKILQWKQKVLHGRYPAEIDTMEIDKEASLEWLKKGQLFPETEGFVMAIQDQVINTKNY